MGKVEEVILSGKYDAPTCQNLVKIISNVPGDANCALIFFETIQKVVKNLENTDLLNNLINTIVRALLRMTIKVPLLYDSAADFIVNLPNYSDTLKSEALYILSRKYQLSQNQHFSKFSNFNPKFKIMIFAN